MTIAVCRGRETTKQHRFHYRLCVSRILSHHRFPNLIDNFKVSKSQTSRVRYPVRPHTFVSPSAESRRAVVIYWQKYVHEVLFIRLKGLSLPRKSVIRLTDRPCIMGCRFTINLLFLISLNRFSDITKSNLWYRIIFCDITNYYVISQNRNSDITKSILWYH